VVAASALQMALPGWLSLGPHWLLPALELGLLCALVVSSPGRLERRSAALRAGGLALAGLLSLANAISAALLVNELAAVRQRICGRPAAARRDDLGR